jgi:hypothetical protein
LRLGVLRRLRPRQNRQVLLHACHGARARRAPYTPVRASRRRVETQISKPRARRVRARLAPLLLDSACRAGPYASGGGRPPTRDSAGQKCFHETKTRNVKGAVLKFPPCLSAWPATGEAEKRPLRADFASTSI